jgi:hypothetical protein
MRFRRGAHNQPRLGDRNGGAGSRKEIGKKAGTASDTENRAHRTVAGFDGLAVAAVRYSYRVRGGSATALAISTSLCVAGYSTLRRLR